MENKTFKKYYLFACIGLLIVSFYPLWMGVRVVTDMIVDGTVMKENYPKYIIPYTPVAIAVIVAVCLMPLLLKKIKKYPLFTASGILHIISSTCLACSGESTGVVSFSMALTRSLVQQP